MEGLSGAGRLFPSGRFRDLEITRLVGGSGVLPHEKIHGDDAGSDPVDDNNRVAEDICLICRSFLPGLYDHIFDLPLSAQRCCDDGNHGLG